MREITDIKFDLLFKFIIQNNLISKKIDVLSIARNIHKAFY